MLIDPVALRGDRWFLGNIYYYPEPGMHFGVPLANYLGWAIVGLISLSIYFPLDRGLPPLPVREGLSITGRLLLGVGLYYGVLTFNLVITFWIGETLLGMSGLLMFLLPTILLAFRLLRWPQASESIVMPMNTLYSVNTAYEKEADRG
jgi:putative membrane protein